MPKLTPKRVRTFKRIRIFLDIILVFLYGFIFYVLFFDKRFGDEFIMAAIFSLGVAFFRAWANWNIKNKD